MVMNRRRCSVAISTAEENNLVAQAHKLSSQFADERTRVETSLDHFGICFWNVEADKCWTSNPYSQD